MKRSIKILSAAMTLLAHFILVPNVKATNHKSNSKYNNNYSNNGSSKSGVGNNNTNGSPSSNTNSTNNIQNDEEVLASEMYPFSKAEDQVEDEDIVGIIVTKSKIVYVSRYQTYFTEDLSEDGRNFSQLNYFTRFKNLMSVSFREVELSTEELQNLEDFLASAQSEKKDEDSEKVKIINFESCVFEEANVKYVSNIIKKLDALVAISIKFPKTKKKRGTKTELVDLSPKAVEELTAAISDKKGLVQLVLAFGTINTTSCNHIKTVLEQSPNIANALLAWEQITGDGIEESYSNLNNVISGLTKLVKLCISILYIPEPSIDSTFNALSNLNTLSELTLFVGNLCECKNSFELASILGKSLSNLTGLSSLQLQNMELSGNSMQALLQGLRKLKRLKYFDISNNEITKECVDIFEEALPELDKLRVFIARGCNIESLANLYPIIEKSALEIICLANNLLRDDVQQFKPSENMMFVELSNNKISSKSILAAARNIIPNQKLKFIDFRNNADLNSEVRDKIEQLQSNFRSLAAFMSQTTLSKSELKEIEEYNEGPQNP